MDYNFVLTYFDATLVIILRYVLATVIITTSSEKGSRYLGLLAQLPRRISLSPLPLRLQPLLIPPVLRLAEEKKKKKENPRQSTVRGKRQLHAAERLGKAETQEGVLTCRRRSCSSCHFSCRLRSSSRSHDQLGEVELRDGTWSW